MSPEGRADVAITRSPTSITELDLTVSGFNMVPFLGTVAVGSGEISGLVPEPESDPTTVSMPATAPRLLGNHPNPFNPDTRIVFELPRQMRVRLAVFDIRGRLVKTILEEQRDAGRQEATWNGQDNHGGSAASGVYLYRLETEEGAFTGRMTLGK